MKTRHFFAAVLALLCISLYGQSEPTYSVKKRISVTELKVETDNLEELKNFDWEEVKAMFADTDPDHEIVLSIAYVGKSEGEEDGAKVDKFEMKASGKASQIDDLTQKLSRAYSILDKMDP